MKNLEHRNITTKISVRESANGNGEKEIFGLAIPFDKPSLPIFEEEDFAFIEYIDANAFDESINSDDEIMLLCSHEWNAPLARRSVGRLKITKESDGIYFTATPPDTTRTQDLLKDIESGNIQGNSFGFVVEADEWSKDENGINIRKVLKGKLYEISTVVNPAYPDTTLAKRSLKNFKTEKKKTNLNLRKAQLRLLRAKIK